MIHVLEPGLQTTVQDLGRIGLGDQGISPAGPMDSLALRLGNLIVGNPPAAAALEITLVGPRLRFESDAVIALAGAPFLFELKVEGSRLKVELDRSEVAGSTFNFQPSTFTPLPLWQAVRVRAGDVVRIGAAAAGARAYLCVAGGIDTPPLHGSRATHLMAGLGGLEGRALQAGDRLPLGKPAKPLAALVGRRLKPSLRPTYSAVIPVRVLLGPQAERFTEDARAAFLGQPYTVTPDSNRMGVRLSGPALTHTRGADLLSEGIALGAIQVPQSGQPIILMVDRQTTGGYTKIATVIVADIARVGQARPGARLHFQAVSLKEAIEARQSQEALVSKHSVERAEAWGATDVVEVMRAFAESGLGEMKLRAGGVKLTLKRATPTARERPTWREEERLPEIWDDDGVDPFAPVPGREDEAEAAAPEAGADDETASVEITAPLLGVFYAQPAPDAPPFVRVGDHVEEGQVVALIDVMKTHHHVRATHDGQVEAVLAESGTLVEYGQPLLALRVEKLTF